MVPGVCDVVLPDVAVDPVAEVEVLVVHRDDDVGHDAGHVGQDPAGHLLGRDLDHLLGAPVSRGFPEESAGGWRRVSEWGVVKCLYRVARGGPSPSEPGLG